MIVITVFEPIQTTFEIFSNGSTIKKSLISTINVFILHFVFEKKKNSKKIFISKIINTYHIYKES